MSTATPGSILVEIHSSLTDASCEVIEDGESIFIVFWGFIKASVSKNQDCRCKVKKNVSYAKIYSFSIPVIYCYLVIILKVSMIFIFVIFILLQLSTCMVKVK